MYLVDSWKNEVVNMDNAMGVYVESGIITAVTTGNKKVVMGVYEPSEAQSRFEDFLAALATDTKVYQFPTE